MKQFKLWIIAAIICVLFDNPAVAAAASDVGKQQTSVETSPSTTSSSQSSSSAESVTSSTTTSSSSSSTTSVPEGSTSTTTSSEASTSSSSFFDNLYAGLEGGFSISRNNVDFEPTSDAPCTATVSCWDNPHQSFKNDIGNSPVYGARIGYRIGKVTAIDVSYDARNNFEWDKNFPADPNNFPIRRNRKIDSIRNQTVMLNVILTPNLQWEKIDPFFNGGVGYSRNRLGNLVSTNLNTGSQGVIEGDTSSSLAWQVGAGLNVITNSHLFFDLGYRFMDIGKMKTGNQVINPVVAPIPRLRADHAFLHEVYAGINIFL